MKIQQMIKITGLYLTLMLASCGADSSNALENIGTLTVSTTPNNVVSIGESGTNFKVADASGKALFSSLTAGAIDVHVFTADGYKASSYYGVNSSVLNDTTISFNTIAGSVVDIYAALSNGVNPSIYLDMGNGESYSAFYNSFTNIASFRLYQKSGGITINGTLYALNGQASSLAGNTLSGGASEIINLGTASFTTVAFPGTATAQGQPYTGFFLTAPATPTLINVQSVTPPAGMVVTDMSFDQVRIRNYGTLNFPDSIKSAPLQNSNHAWIVRAQSPMGTKWSKTGNFTPGGNVNIAATMLTSPSFTVDQAGNTLSWTESPDPHVGNKLDIMSSTDYRYYWSILTASGVKQITLPTIPSVVMNPMPSGSAYYLKLSSFNIAGVSYQRFIAVSNPNDLSTERIDAPSILYTR